FPGKFVALNYGTNDANSNLSPDTFYTNMATMVQDIITAGKTPIIPTIPWGCTTNLTANVPTFNAKVQALYTAYPQIIKGPDLYTYFLNNQSYISGADCIHPNAAGGWTAYRAQWAQAMTSAVYTAPAAGISPTGGSVTSAQTVTLTSSKAGTLYYTTDGTTPTVGSHVYTNTLTVASTQTIKVLAVDQAGNQSDIASATYTFPAPSPSPSPTPTPSPSPTPATPTSSKSTATATPTASVVTPTPQPAPTPTPTETAPQTTTSNTPSRTVILTVTDQHGKPLANTDVSLGTTSQTATTNAQGTAIFYNVTPGTYTVHAAHYTDVTIQVTTGTSAQSLSAHLIAATSHASGAWALGIAGMAVCIIIAIAVAIRRRLKPKKI